AVAAVVFAGGGEQHAATLVLARPDEPVRHDRAQARQAARLLQRRQQHVGHEALRGVVEDGVAGGGALAGGSCGFHGPQNSTTVRFISNPVTTLARTCAYARNSARRKEGSPCACIPCLHCSPPPCSPPAPP